MTGNFIIYKTNEIMGIYRAFKVTDSKKCYIGHGNIIKNYWKSHKKAKQIKDKGLEIELPATLYQRKHYFIPKIF